MRLNLTQALSLLATATVVAILAGVAFHAPWLNLLGTRALIPCALLLPIAPAISLGSKRAGQPVPAGLRVAGGITGRLAIVFGVLFIAVMFLAMSLALLGLGFAVLCIFAGAFAAHRASANPPGANDHPTIAYLAPAVCGIVLLAGFFRGERAPEWDRDRGRVGV
jgi:hypothetical protein